MVALRRSQRRFQKPSRNRACKPLSRQIRVYGFRRFQKLMVLVNWDDNYCGTLNVHELWKTRYDLHGSLHQL